MAQKQNASEKIVEKGETDGNQLFPAFFTLLKTEIVIFAPINLSPANTFKLVKVKMLLFRKEFILYQTTKIWT